LKIIHATKRLIVLVFSTTALIGPRAENVSVPTLASDTSRVTDLDEIVVVALPKESGLLRTKSLSSSVFLSSNLQTLDLRDVRQISLYVPSFVMPDYGSRYTSSAYVRGIGAKEGSSAIGMYLNGIPLATKSMYNFHFYGLERVDVLRGPQGTLYGMNSEGGLVRMFSHNPMNRQGTQLKVGGGTYGARTIEAIDNRKWNEKAATSLAAFYTGKQGFFDNQTTGKQADLSNEAGTRLRALFRPSQSLSFDLTGDYQWVRQNGFPYGPMDSTNYRVHAPLSNYQGQYRRHLLVTGLTAEWKAPRFILGSATSFQFLRDYLKMDIDYTAADLMRMHQNQRQQAFTQEITFKGRSEGRWQWTSGAFFSHTGNKVEAPVFFQPAMNDYLSQTIQDYAYNGMFNAMSGRRMLELMQEGLSREEAMRLADEETAANIEARGGCRIRMDISQPIFGHFSTPQQNLGLFHESSYSFTNRFTATLGLRYDFCRVAIDYHTGAVASLDESVLGVNVKATITDILRHTEQNCFNQLLPKASLNWRFSDNGSNVYATFSKGFRAGGYNIQSFGDILQYELRKQAQAARSDLNVEHDAQAYAQIADAITYRPETSWNYELGTHLNLFNHRLQVDAALYYMQVRNQQVARFADNYGYGRLIQNAARSSNCGLEIALHGRAFDNRLSYHAAYGYTHAVFKQFLDTDDNGNPVSYKGKCVPFVPCHTLSVHADYRFSLPCKALPAIHLGVNQTAMGKTYWDDANTYAQSFYATLGAHLRLVFSNNLSLSLWGHNLTNTRYRTFAFDSSATGSRLFFAQLGAPRQFAAEVEIKF